MSEWTSGYVADVDYTYGYYRELNPLLCKLALLNAGVHSPNFEHACELGFGQGLSTNFHAAASNTKWWGTDFNPAQAGFARELSIKSGAESYLYDGAFSEFCARDDLPDFDFIGLHGIWSWISDDNRRVIVDFIRRKLRVGGVLYISYNTLPGWASFAPLRHLMTAHAEIVGSEGRGIVSRIDGAVDFAKQLMETNPLYKRANPLVEERLGKLAEQNRHYLAHEYFNKDWDPMHFSTMARWLGPAKVDYGCSANLLDHFPNLNMNKSQQEFINGIPDQLLKQSTIDFMINQQFRRDYWIKGARRLSALERDEELSKLQIMLVLDSTEFKFKVSGALGEAGLKEDLYRPILEMLADHESRTILELYKQLKDRNVQIAFSTLVEALMILAGSGHVALVQNEEEINRHLDTAKALNKHLMIKARSGSDIEYLLSPVSGGGVAVNRFCQLFLAAMELGYDTPEKMAEYVWQSLARQAQRIVKDGKVIESEEENRAELEEQARNFVSKRLSLMKKLKVC